jgi:hypothetical protein
MNFKKIISFDIGIRNLGVTCVEYSYQPQLSEEGEFYSWKNFYISQLELIDIVDELSQGKKTRAGSKPKNAKNINIHELCQGIVKILMKRSNWLDNVTDIRVEQQPIQRSRFGGGGGSLGSVRMKIIQHCILTFYESYYAIHSHLTKPLINPSSPANKLKCVVEEHNFCLEPLSETDKNTNYQQRKEKAVENFEKLLPWCTIKPELKTLFEDIKKKNDLADCVLQALFELQSYGVALHKKRFKIPKQVKEKPQEISIDGNVESKQPAKTPKKRKTPTKDLIKDPSQNLSEVQSELLKKRKTPTKDLTKNPTQNQSEVQPAKTPKKRKTPSKDLTKNPTKTKKSSPSKSKLKNSPTKKVKVDDENNFGSSQDLKGPIDLCLEN